MNTDRELLELAARAAGVCLVWIGDYPSEIVVEWVGDMHEPPCERDFPWNPLQDDVIAFRLSVQLKIDVKHYEDYVVAWFDGGFVGTGRIDYDGDAVAATRRAITRAAAQMQLDKEKA